MVTETYQALLSDELNRALINRLQQGLPVCSEPFQQLAEELQTTPAVILERITQFLDCGLATRFGPMFQIERAGGAFTLVATHVDEHRFDEVAAIVNARHEVAHNYRREHWLNMWFVLACEQPQQVACVLDELEKASGCEMLNFPKEQEFYVQLYLPV
ncbi:MAG: AsnC family protein [Oceanospirillaceae bacterium]|nr:AsnC family protein [Oceanospirillaceae bacterium]